MTVNDMSIEAFMELSLEDRKKKYLSILSTYFDETSPGAIYNKYVLHPSTHEDKLVWLDATNDYHAFYIYLSKGYNDELFEDAGWTSEDRSFEDESEECVFVSEYIENDTRDIFAIIHGSERMERIDEIDDYVPSKFGKRSMLMPLSEGQN